MAIPSVEKNIAEETQREVSSCSSADAARGRGGEARGRKQNWESKEEERREITILLSSLLTLVVCSTERQAPHLPISVKAKPCLAAGRKKKVKETFLFTKKREGGNPKQNRICFVDFHPKKIYLGNVKKHRVYS